MPTIDAASRTDTSGTGHGGGGPSPPNGAAGWSRPTRETGWPTRKGQCNSTRRDGEAPRTLQHGAVSAAAGEHGHGRAEVALDAARGARAAGHPAWFRKRAG